MLPCQEPLFMPIKKESKQLPSRANSPSGLSKPPASSRVGLRENVRAFKRELIINAAIEVFYRDGYQSATVDDVAASMSMTKAVVYYYFKSKETLLQAIIERCSEITSTARTEAHTYELKSLMRTSNAVFCLKKK